MMVGGREDEKEGGSEGRKEGNRLPRELPNLWPDSGCFLRCQKSVSQQVYSQERSVLETAAVFNVSVQCWYDCR